MNLCCLSTRKSILLAFLAFSLFVLGSDWPLEAAEFYVDSASGDDAGGNGTKTLPWKTLTYALNQSSPGDTIHVFGTLDASTGEVFPLTLTDRTIAGHGVLLSTIDSGNASDAISIAPSDPSKPSSVTGLTIQAGSGYNAITISSAPFPGPTRIEDCQVKNSKIGILVHTSMGDCSDPKTAVATLILASSILSGNQEAVVARTGGSNTTCDLTVVNNTFVNNQTALTVQSEPEIDQCLDDPNSLDCTTCSNPPFCRLAVCRERTLLALNNNIFATNGTGILEIGQADTRAGSIRNNDFFSNGQNYVDQTLGAVSDVNQLENASSNFIQDPFFFDSAGEDFHITENSPCRDYVSPSASAGAPQKDIDGQSRPWGTGFDVGADEVSLTDLKYLAQTIIDECASGGGGGNTYPDPGENIDLTVTLINQGSIRSRDITAEISTNDPWVGPANGSLVFNDIDQWVWGDSLTPFHFFIDPNAPCPHSIPFTLSIAAREGKFYDTFAVDIFDACLPCDITADLTFLGCGLVDSCARGGGGENSLAEPGETIKLYPGLLNNGPATAMNVTARIETTAPGVILPSSRILHYGNIDPGVFAVPQEPYTCNLDQTLSCGTSIPFTIVVDSQQDSFTDTFSVDIPVGCTPCPPPYLTLEPVSFTDICDSGGAGGNGKIDPGETIDLELSLTNSAAIDAEGVTAEIFSLTSGIEPDRWTVVFPTIPSSESRSSSNSYHFFVNANDIRCGDVLEFQVNVSWLTQFYTYFFTIQVPTDCTPCIVSQGGCVMSYPIQHADWSGFEERFGFFDLQGTKYDGVGVKTGVEGPEIRFWEFDNFAGASSGLEEQHRPGSEWLLSALVDIGNASAPPESWCLVNADWKSPSIHGCPQNPLAARTVVELSFIDSLKEGTPQHRSVYVIASTLYDFSHGCFNLDNVRGGNGPFGNYLPVASIPVPQPQDIKGTKNAFDASFMDVVLNLPPAVSYSEVGTPNLITEYKLYYMNDPATISGEAETSDPSAYLPVADPADPATLLGIIPYGTSSVTVSVPNPVQFSFFVTRIVYADTSAQIISNGVSGHASGIHPPDWNPPNVTDLLSVHCTSIAPPAPSLDAILPLTPATADYTLPALHYPGTASDSRNGILTDVLKPLVFYRLSDSQAILILKATKNGSTNTVDFNF